MAYNITSIYWQSDLGADETKVAKVFNRTEDFILTWTPDKNYGTNYQVQWKYRKRYTPPQALIHGGIGEDVWTDWTDWSGNTALTQPSQCTTIEVVKQPFYRATLNQTFSFPWSNTSTYDAEEWQVRVRVFSTSGTVGDWFYSDVLKVAYCPNPTISIYQNEYKDWCVNADFNWGRDGFGIKLEFVGKYIDRTKGSTKYDAPRWEGLTDETVNILPAYYLTDLDDGYDVGDTVRLLPLYWTPDRISYNPNITQRVVLGAAPVSPALPVPAYTIEQSDYGTMVITVEDDDYTVVGAMVRWSDEEGNSYQESLDNFTLEDGNWTSELIGLPLDVDINTRLVVQNSGGDYGVKDVVTVLPSNGHFGFTNGETNIALNLGLNKKPDRTQAITPNVTSIKVAGRELPIARFGTGHTRTYTLSAIVQDNWKNWDIERKADIEKLRDGGIWIYYAPGGEYRKVIVTGFNFSTTDVVGVQEVKINVQEVDATW